MNGTSGFQEERSSTSRSLSDRFQDEQRHQFGKCFWYLLKTPISPREEITHIAPQIHIKNQFFLLPTITALSVEESA